MEAQQLNNSIKSPAANLSDWLDWLNQYNEQHPKLGIEKLLALAKQLDLINWDIPVITVAGTNGKGSTVIAIESLLLNLGLKVGSFMSPHIHCFSERFRINGINPSLSVLEEFFVEAKAYQLTFFETCTFMALLLFKQAKLDVIVLEVGLGGRLDATNIVNNNIAVITSIGLDHMEFLGNNILDIAREKAGIIKQDQHVVVGVVEEPVYQVIAKIALSNKAMLHRVESLTSIDKQNFITASLVIKVLNKIDNKFSTISTKYALQHTVQANNFSNIKLKGRLQYENYLGHTMLLDGAHNPAASRWLLQNLQWQNFVPSIAVVNFAKNKDWQNSIKLFADLVEHWYILDVDNIRLHNADELTIEMSKYLQSRVKVISDLSFLKQAPCVYNILVFGSFMVVGKVLDIISCSEHSLEKNC